jgi:hypothetical protein
MSGFDLGPGQVAFDLDVLMREQSPRGPGPGRR